MLELLYENQFKKDLKLVQKRGKNAAKLFAIVDLLLHGEPIAPKNRNHKLSGVLQGYWELHIEPDWLLLYYVRGDDLILARTGSHADLFK